jgi:hypothetical protein
MKAVHQSNMSGKLDGFKSISTNTKTNRFCISMHNSKKKDQICTKCYSHKMLDTYRKNMEPALQRNSDLLSSRNLDDTEVPLIMEAFYRFNAHGELINMQHLVNLVKIVEHNPHCTFALWTKRKNYIKELFSVRPKPANLILIYSNPKISNILKEPPLHFDKTFNNVLEHENVSEQNCTGQKCKNCLLCYKHNGVDTIVEMVKKY